MDRRLDESIYSDLKEKMVILGGPRQVGKTTLAQMIGRKFRKSQYLLWDLQADRKRILHSQFDTDADLIIFDELHKYRNWKNLLKGIYDSPGRHFAILVTGSARLNLYRKGGDSLQGRYHYYRLSPFTLSEFAGRRAVPEPFSMLEVKDNENDRNLFRKLLLYGGFPEPLLKENSRTLRRWQKERVDRLVREDIRDTESIREISRIQILADVLPERVGSLFSINSVREDLEATHKSIADWMNILENFYYCFRIYPFTHSRIRSLRKEPKIYLWDWSEVPGEGARLENLVASHLQALCHTLEDTEGYRAVLSYLRDTDKRETDFLVSIKDRPWFSVEVKSGDRKLSKNQKYFAERLQIPYCFQLTTLPDIDYVEQNIRIISVERFLSVLV
ncbi:MAG: ATP-binding protein [Vulcanimicrobiota bacterium]